MRYFLCYRSSFRYESAPNISHEVWRGNARTLCGRDVASAETFEPHESRWIDFLYGIQADCIRCRERFHREISQAIRDAFRVFSKRPQIALAWRTRNG